jgi:drug/metabolite transporter (DMT)-like permease
MQFAASALVMLPYVLLTENLSALRPTPTVLLLLLLVGVLHTGIAYVLYFSGVTGVSAQTAALLSYIDPVVAVLLSVTVLKEPMSPPALLGAALVIGAMLASEITPGEKD